MALPACVEALRGSPRARTLRLTEALAVLTFPTSEPLLTDVLEGISLLSQEPRARGTTFMHATKALTRARTGVMTGVPLAATRFLRIRIDRFAGSSARRLESHRVRPLSSGR